jgi:hypothetical protein
LALLCDTFFIGYHADDSFANSDEQVPSSTGVTSNI